MSTWHGIAWAVKQQGLLLSCKGLRIASTAEAFGMASLTLDDTNRLDKLAAEAPAH